MHHQKGNAVLRLILLLIVINTSFMYMMYGNSNVVVVSADVGVICPFSLTLSPSSLYVKQAGASIPYSIKALTQCTTSVTGNLIVENTLTSNVYDTINANFANVGQTPTNGFFTISPSVLQLGTSKATFTENSLNTSNSTSASFPVFSAANILIQSLNVSPSSPSVGSDITLTINVVNDGSLASSNMIWNVKIDGPSGFTYVTNTPGLSGLSPGANEVSSFSISGVTSTSGLYTVISNVSYQTTVNSVTVNEISSNAINTYTVPSPSGGGSGGGGGGGGSGQQRPIINPINSTCFQVSNIAQLNTFSVTILGQTVRVTDNFITPNYTGVTANGNFLELYPGLKFYVNGTTGITLFLKNVSYIPVLHTVTIDICQSSPVPTGISSLAYTSMPLVTSVIAGNSTVASIGLRNAGITPLWANITIPRLPYGTISLSANSIYMLPGQTLLVQMLFHAFNDTSGSYITPVNITVTAQGESPASSKFYIGFTIVQPQSKAPDVLRSTSFIESGHQILTQYSIYNPTNAPIYNARLTALLPASITNSTNKILLSGPVGNITTINSQYILGWRIPVLQPHGTSIFSFAVSNVSTPEYFFSPITTFSVLVVNNASNVRIFDLHVPTFYVGQQYNITLSSLYTGTNQTNLTISLQPPLGVAVRNQAQVYRVFPNTMMQTNFYVYPISESGTYLFQLTIKGGGVNGTYSIPVVVLQQNQLLPPASNQTGTGSVSQGLGDYIPYIAAGAVIALLVAILLISAYGRARGSRYNVRRAEELSKVKQRVRRDLDNESKSDTNRRVPDDEIPSER